MTSCGCTIATGVPELTFEEVLGVLFGWLNLEIEIGTHGANGAQPVAAVDVQGELHRGDELGNRSASGSTILFVLRSDDGAQVGSLRLYEQAFQGGGWYDDDEEVLEVRSGMVQILIATVQKPEACGGE